MDLVKYILTHSDWLYTKIYENPFFFFDLWTIVHIWSGFVLILLLRSARAKRPFLILFSILTTYEIFEILFTYFAFNIFRPETIKDQFTDIFVGMAGGILASYFIRFAINKRTTHRATIFRIVALVAAISYAYPWVGFYKYHYSTVWMNSPGINYTALYLWICGGYITILIFQSLKYKNLLLRLMMTWSCYLVLLFGFEFMAYYILGVHENGRAVLTPMLFGLIHGTKILHFFYLISPLCTISLYAVFRLLINKCVTVEKPEYGSLEALNNAEL